MLKYSRQRQLILDAVCDNVVHPTADFIYSKLKEDNPNLSLGTVYRNLNLLAHNGVIKKIPMPNESDRFDSRTDEHYHIICTNCGCVHDCNVQVFENVEGIIAQKTGFEITNLDIVVKGVCKECNKKIIKKEVI